MSTNLQKASIEQGEDVLAEEDEKPGTSASFFGSAHPGNNDEVSSDSNMSEGVGVARDSTTTVKGRNTSREKPHADTPRSKRLRVAGKDEDDIEDDIHMDTDTPNPNDEPGLGYDDSSDNDGQGQRVLENPEAAANSVPVNDPDMRDSVDAKAPEPDSARPRNSNTDDDVSTTMHSSLRHRSLFLNDTNLTDFPESHSPIPSTSAATVPSSGRMKGTSSVVEEAFRLPAFQLAGRGNNQGDLINPRSLRDMTPDPSAAGHLDDLYFQKKDVADENENRGSNAFLQKMQGNQRLMWARKLFFLSTEFVFPGFTAYRDSKNEIPAYMGVRVRSSCLMQALLYADSLFFIMWVLSFVSTCDILMTVLKELHGYLSVCLTCLFIIVNILRIRFGLKGNENDEVQYLALFWMTTVIVQIPLFGFIFLTDLLCPVLLAFTVTMDGAMMVFIILESVIGFIHFRSLLRDELNIIKMARRSKEASQSRPNVPIRHEEQGVPLDSGTSRHFSSREEDGNSSSDAESDNDGFESRDDNMDFRMQIRRLSGVERTENQQDVDQNDDSDSSEQVSSTSDAIRQRPIRAH